jgi:hypothetical protein
MKSYSFRSAIVLTALILLCGISAGTTWANDPFGLCDHPLYPLREGTDAHSRWVYGTGDGNTLTREVSSIIPLGRTMSVAMMETNRQGKTIPGAMECTGDGLSRVVPEQFFLPLPPLGTIKYSMIDQSGVLLPPMGQITGESFWETYYVLEMKVTTRRGKILYYEVQAFIESTVMGQTEVTVPAGTFDAWEIEQAITLWLTPTEPPPPTPEGSSRVIEASRAWFLAEGVGLVLQQSLSRGGPIDDLELEEYFMPQE